MYNIKLTDDLYFSGNYAKSGTVDGGVYIPYLPPTDDLSKQLFYRWGNKTVQIGVDYVPVMVQEKDGEDNLLWEDEEKTIPKMVQDTNEDGSLKFTEEPIMGEIEDWIFDEDGYNTWKAEQDTIVPEPTDGEKIAQLENKLMEANLVITSLMLDILPEIAGI